MISHRRQSSRLGHASPDNPYDPLLFTDSPAPRIGTARLRLAAHDQARRKSSRGLLPAILLDATTMKLLSAICWLLRSLVLSRSRLVLENLALRQQLAILIRQQPRPTLRRGDRLFWIFLSKLWTEWRSALLIVQPDTVVRWHQQGFRLYWRWKSRSKRAGRPPLAKDIRVLIGWMARDNPTGAHHASRPNCIYWDTMSPKPPWPSTWLGRDLPSRHHRPGRRFCTTMSACWLQWFFSSCPRLLSACSTFW